MSTACKPLILLHFFKSYNYTPTKIEYSCHSQSWILYFHIYIDTAGVKRGVFVQELDNEFFEAYKRLDHLCSDIYGCRNGVSQYIEDMDGASYQGRLWEHAYKTLKHLRWVRNQIAHDSGQILICDESDSKDVNNFYDDIMSGCDPLTQLRRYREHRAATKKTVRRAEPTAMSTASNHADTVRPPRRRTGYLDAAILFLVGTVAIIVYLLTNLL